MTKFKIKKGKIGEEGIPTADRAAAPPRAVHYNHHLIKKCDADHIPGPVFPLLKETRKEAAKLLF